MKFLVKDLRELCFQRGLNTLGKKADLVERLLAGGEAEPSVDAGADEGAVAPTPQAKGQKTTEEPASSVRRSRRLVN